MHFHALRNKEKFYIQLCDTDIDIIPKIGFQ